MSNLNILPKDGENRQAYSYDYAQIKLNGTLQLDLSILLILSFGVIELLLRKQPNTRKNSKRNLEMGFEEC